VQLSVSSDRHGDVLTIAVAGDVDVSTSPIVDEAISQALAASGVATVCVDLSAVEFLDSSGIAALIAGRRGADGQGVGYRVEGAQGIVRHVLELTGVWDLLCGDAGYHRNAT
jgi:anti-sigma B factor antagonist